MRSARNIRLEEFKTMDAIAAKARAARTHTVSPPITLNDILATILVFGTISCLTLLFIVTMA